MGRHDWYRNEDWNDEISEAFFTKLKRAREKNQYLRIQANYLGSSHPDVALCLLDKYFELDRDFFDSASAYSQQAQIHIKLGNIEKAIISYENSLKQEVAKPYYKSETSLMLPMLFVEHNLEQYFQKGIEILEKNTDYVKFPVSCFQWHAAMAIFKYSLGEKGVASMHAGQALDAAEIEKSGFRFHQKLGLVDEHHRPMIKKLRLIYKNNSSLLNRLIPY